MDRQLGDTKWKIEDDFQARQVADNEMNSVDPSFWSRYLEEHKNPVNCMLHVLVLGDVGASSILSKLVAAYLNVALRLRLRMGRTRLR